MNLTRRSTLGLALAALSSTFAQAQQGPRTRLVILGTEGGPMILPNRKMAGQAIVFDNRIFLIDVGYGVVGRMVEAKLPFTQVEAALITHAHSDHVSDYPMFAYQAGRTRKPTDAPIRVFGPPSTRQMHEGAAAVFAEDFRVRRAGVGGADPFRDQFQVTELEGPGQIYAASGVKITAARANHPPTVAYAYRIDTPDRSIVVSGDTTASTAVMELSRGADVLVHEAMHLPALEGRRLDMTPASRAGMIAVHTSVEEAAELAQRAGVKTLVLSHLIPGEVDIDEAAWKAAAAKKFAGPVIMARDLMVI